MTAVFTPLLLTLGPAAVLVVMLVVFAETGLLLGFVLPGDSLLFLSGALVTSHVIGVPIWLLMIGVVLAAAAGDQLGYLIGRRYGPAVFRRETSRLLRPEYADRAHDFFERRGNAAVIIGRFIPIIRTFTPTVAGVARMPRGRFTAYNVVGAVLWGTAMVALGALFGGIPLVAHHVEVITIGFAGLSVVPLGIELLRMRRSRARAVQAPGPSEPAGTSEPAASAEAA